MAAASWKTVRVFISSTFRDMHRERDHLARVVFPELKERCRTKRVQLVDVDLRWGVTEADARHGKALDICLDEIDSCRPYFVGILGHRYGFVPEGHRRSVTAQEIYHGVLHGNAPKQVVDLRKILEEQLEGYTLSSEQKDCLVRCYMWDVDKRKYLLQEILSPYDAEIIRSVFERYSIYQKNQSFFFFRSEALSHEIAGTMTSDLSEQNREDREKLESLKSEIVDAGLPHFEYANIEGFGQLVLNTLWKRIEAEAEQSPGEERDWLGQEAALHELFMADRTRRFVGRRDLLERMHGFCNSDEDPSLLLITGEPGCGKSALMARFTEEASRQHPDRLILGHFVGASPSSTSLRQMLRRLCTQLNRAAGSNEAAPEDIKELLKLFPELLVKASEQRSLLIIIDAVNQLEQLDHAHSMHWLPQMLPKNVRLVISTLAGNAHEAMLQRRIKPQKETVPGLTAPEIRELAGTYLREIRHEFPNLDVEGEFYRKLEQGNPLYILVALEELRVFGQFEELDRRINRLPDNVPDLFEQVLERIESDFNPALAGDCMSYIACGRRGMTAEELQTLLKAHAPRIDQNSEAPKLPDMLWSRLYRSLSAYLFERSGVIDFFHGQLKEAVGKRYLQEESSRDAAHCAIAGYLETRWREPYARALDELPHQQMRARSWQALVEILCDLQFIELKCQSAMTYDLAADYESALGAEGVRVEWRSGLDDFARFVHAQSHVLVRNAALTFQQAANEPDSTAPARAARARIEAGLEARPWLQYVNKPQSRSACLMTLVGHSNQVNACAFSPDGSRIVSGSGDKTLKLWDAKTGAELATLAGHTSWVNACAFSPDGSRIVSGSNDKTLKLWDTKTGADLATLASHRRSVEACAFSSDGSRIVSASAKTLKLWDAKTGAELATLASNTRKVLTACCCFSPDDSGIITGSQGSTLKLWDAKTGAELATLAGHTSEVTACAYSPDGSRIVSASWDETLRLWDAKTGAELATLKGHFGWVDACAFSPDGCRIVSASQDSTLRLWDAKTGAELAILAHTDWVSACAFSPDGSRIVSASDNTLKLWDAKRGADLATRARHTNAVKACAFSPDGRRIVSASEDQTLKLWDAKTGVELACLAGHRRSVKACAFSPDSSRIVSASSDNTLKLWDSKTGAELATLAGHTSWVNACAFSPDSSRIVSAAFALKLWDGETGDELAHLGGHNDEVEACAFSPEGRRIVSASLDDTLMLWDAKTGAKLATLAGHTDSVWACAFSPDGSRIVSASEDSTVKLWDAQAGAELATLAGHTSMVWACAFSPDGSRIVSASDDHSLKLWDAQTGAELATLAGHTDQVLVCAFSPDGSRIVSASFDNSLKLWDAETGAQIWEFEIGGCGKATAWSPRGRDLAAGDRLGQLSILRLQNFSFGPVVVTPWQHNPYLLDSSEAKFHFGCPLCRVWSEVAALALGAVIPCPHCGESIKLNPFTVNADWRDIAASWKATANDE